MKLIGFKSLGIFILALTLTTGVMAAGQQVDVQKSKVEWTGKKVTGQHTGTIDIQQGTLEVNKGKLSGGKIVINMQSIKDVDLTDETYNAKLIGHLKSDDFFSVEKYPTSQLDITKVEGSGANLTVTGNLTIKGKTNPVSFPVTVSKSGKENHYQGTITIDRTKYDVRYGSKSFFNDLGDKAISDEFALDFHLVATE